MRLADRLLKAAAILALLYAPLLVWRISTVPWHLQLGVNALFVLLGIGLFPFISRLSLQLKSALVVGAPLAIGLSGVFTMGMTGPGYLWTLEAAVLAAALYSLRAGVMLAVGGAVLLLVAGVGFVSGILIVPLDLNAHLASPSAWIGFFIVVVFAPLSLLYSLANYQAMTVALAHNLDTQRQQLAKMVGHDQLTGLPLSALGMDRFRMLLAGARRTGQMMALLFIDLDGFKAVNDEHGHAAGDHLLTMIGRRLHAIVREADTVARVGGDEFIVILANVSEPKAAVRVAEKLLIEIAAPLIWHDRHVSVSASIGIALFPEHGQDAEQLRRAADAAMYQAKNYGKNRYRLASVAAKETLAA